MSENGFCLWEGLQRDGGWGLLRSVGLTPSSAPQPPPPVKGTFLFGERRGHFYRWTTFTAYWFSRSPTIVMGRWHS
jgi:hypothetical protein